METSLDKSVSSVETSTSPQTFEEDNVFIDISQIHKSDNSKHSHTELTARPYTSPKFQSPQTTPQTLASTIHPSQSPPPLFIPAAQSTYAQQLQSALLDTLNQQDVDEHSTPAQQISPTQEKDLSTFSLSPGLWPSGLLKLSHQNAASEQVFHSPPMNASKTGAKPFTPSFPRFEVIDEPFSNTLFVEDTEVVRSLPSSNVTSYPKINLKSTAICSLCHKGTLDLYKDEQFIVQCQNPLCACYCCFIAGCIQVFTDVLHARRHLNEAHRAFADPNKCFQCQSQKTRGVTKAYDKCKYCKYYWCLIGNCNFEFTVYIALRMHALCHHRSKKPFKTKHSPASVSRPQSYLDTQESSVALTVIDNTAPDSPKSQSALLCTSNEQDPQLSVESTTPAWQSSPNYESGMSSLPLSPGLPITEVIREYDSQIIFPIETGEGVSGPHVVSPIATSEGVGASQTVPPITEKEKGESPATSVVQKSESSKCHKCGEDSVVPYGIGDQPFIGQCTNTACRYLICLVQNCTCSYSKHNLKRLNLHLNSKHRAYADPSKCSQCGSEKIRGQSSMVQCKTCRYYLCLVGNCNYEFTNVRGISGHLANFHKQ